MAIPQGLTSTAHHCQRGVTKIRTRTALSYIFGSQPRLNTFTAVPPELSLYVDKLSMAVHSCVARAHCMLHSLRFTCFEGNTSLHFRHPPRVHHFLTTGEEHALSPPTKFDEDPISAPLAAFPRATDASHRRRSTFLALSHPSHFVLQHFYIL